MERVSDYIPSDQGQTIVRVGVDIGQKQDPTAIIVTEEVRRDDIPHFLVRSLERLPLGTSYPLVADRIVAVMQNLALRAEARPPRAPLKFTTELIVDGTGVGLPVVDLIRERGLWATVALFTGSDKLIEHPNDTITIGKGYMVSRLQALLQSRRLHFPMCDEAMLLTKELQDYEITVSERGHASFTARSGKHDDLVIALGLSVGMEHHSAPGSSSSYLTPESGVELARWARQRERVQRARGRARSRIP